MERKSPSAKPDLLVLQPVTAAPKKRGRPRTQLTPLQLEGMSKPEEERYQLFINYMHMEYDDMTLFDNLFIELAAIEYVKYIRWLANEIKTGETASMARQNPGVQMRENLKMLSIWRKDRAASPKVDDEVERVVRMFTGSAN